MRRRIPTSIAAVAAAGALLLAMPMAQAGKGNGKPPGYLVDLQILAVNDFHGNLESGGNLTLLDGSRVVAGGAAYLGALVDARRATNPNTAFVSAGDMVGASPLISALFHDEPAVEAFNLMDLDFNAVGNHEFDEGAAELLRLQNGGCHPVDGCIDGDGFTGAEFQFLAANVKNTATGDTIFPSHGIVKMEKGVRVAFIGMTLEGTPTIVTPSGVAGLTFEDEADTVNALVAQLKPQADIVVVLIHEGGTPGAGNFNQCNGISGPIVDIVQRTSDDVDLFITGHTHQAYLCNIDGRPVTSTNAFGRLLTDIDITYNNAAHEIVGMNIENVPVLRTGTPDADLTALVTKYATLSAPLANRVVGQISASITRTANAAGESALGDVIADAQLGATSAPTFGGAVVAFMNPGGIRTDLVFDSPPGTGGAITYSESFAVQPFGNSLVTMTLTGAQIDTMLEQQFDNPSAPGNRILQVSAGFTYSWSASAPTGSKVDSASIKINGVPVSATSTYRVTVNSFLADGGDNFVVLRQGTDRLGGAVDLDAQQGYFAAQGVTSPGPQNRITRLP